MQLIRAAFSSLSPEKRVDRHRSPQVGDRLGYMDCIARPCMWLHNNCTYRSTNQGAHVCVAPYVMLDLHALNPTKRHCQATPRALPLSEDIEVADRSAHADVGHVESVRCPLSIPLPSHRRGIGNLRAHVPARALAARGLELPATPALLDKGKRRAPGTATAQPALSPETRDGVDLALESAAVLDDAAKHNITTLKNDAKRIAIRMAGDSTATRSALLRLTNARGRRCIPISGDRAARSSSYRQNRNRSAMQSTSTGSYGDWRTPTFSLLGSGQCARR